MPGPKLLEEDRDEGDPILVANLLERIDFQKITEGEKAVRKSSNERFIVFLVAPQLDFRAASLDRLDPWASQDPPREHFGKSPHQLPRLLLGLDENLAVQLVKIGHLCPSHQQSCFNGR
jgi:hypothetical protein